VTTFTGPPAESEAGIGALTVGGLLAETWAAHRGLDAVAARSADGTVTRWTYDDLWAESRRYAKGFLATGVGRGTRVGLLLPNRAEWLAAAFGAALCGGVIVPLSDNVTAANVFMMSPADYRDALGELMRLDLSGAHLARAATQVMDLLVGPSGLWAFAPLHLAAMLIVLRVMCAARFEPMLRLTALATIALSPIGLIYSVTVRYNLVMWLLTALITLAWIRQEGLAWLEARAPSLSRRLAAWGTRTRCARLAAWLKAGEQWETSSSTKDAART